MSAQAKVTLGAAVLLASGQAWLLWVFVAAHGRLPDGGGELINWWLGLP